MKVGDLAKVTHGTGNGTVGVIISLFGAGVFGARPQGAVARLHTGEHFSVDRLEVISESR